MAKIKVFECQGQLQVIPLFGGRTLRLLANTSVELDENDISPDLVEAGTRGIVRLKKVADAPVAKDKKKVGE